MTKDFISTAKNILILTLCSLIISCSISGGLYVFSNARQSAASHDAVIRWEKIKFLDTNESDVSSDNAYVINNGEQINDGIHTTNENQKVKELEEVLKKISDETTGNTAN